MTLTVIFHTLMHVYHVAHVHHWSQMRLYQAYVHHHAIRFLLSGRTSENPSGRHAAITLLRWLTRSGIPPQDW